MIEIEEKPVHEKNASIGRMLLDLGKLTPQDAERIIQRQKLTGLRFGEAGLQMGLIKEEDIQLALAHQFSYPYLQVGQGNFSAELVSAYQPFSRQVEAFRALRSQLMLRWFAEGNRSIAVVGAQVGDGCSYLAANLAVVFSQLGERTLLIDANLRSARQHGIFNLEPHRGLSDILAGRINAKETIVRIQNFKDLTVLGAGTQAPNPQELLSRGAFGEFLTHAGNHYDVIIIDTPSANECADFQAVVARTGGALLVTRKNHTRISDLQHLRTAITGLGAQVIGAVLNEH